MPRLRDAQLVAHDFKALPRLTMQPADDTLIAAYLIEPGRSEYLIDDLSAEYGVEVDPGAGGRGRDGCADPPRRGLAPARRAPARSGSSSAAPSGSTTRSSCR